MIREGERFKSLSLCSYSFTRLFVQDIEVFILIKGSILDDVFGIGLKTNLVFTLILIILNYFYVKSNSITNLNEY